MDWSGKERALNYRDRVCVTLPCTSRKMTRRLLITIETSTTKGARVQEGPICPIKRSATAGGNPPLVNKSCFEFPCGDGISGETLWIRQELPFPLTNRS